MDIPKRDIQILTEEIFSLSSAQIFLEQEKKFPEKLQKNFLQALEKRKKNIPVSEILGKQNFFGRNFMVSRDVLTPRAETEVLVEKVLKFSKKNSKKFKKIRVIDIGTGSGAILITLAKELGKKFEYIGVDISDKALEVAKKNAEILGVKWIEFRKSDLFEKISTEEMENSMVVANLPYIPESDVKKMEQEVLEHDPFLALFSGEAGLDLYTRFFQEISRNFSAVFFEFHMPQREFFERVVKEKFPEKKIEFFADFNGDVRFGIVS